MPRIRCPKCGSETAKILWGMPVWSEKLEKDVEEKRIYIGGCEIMMPPPSRHCFTCDDDVCYTFFPQDEMATVAVEFEIGGFFGGFQKIVVERHEDNYTASYFAPFSAEEAEKIIELTADEYVKFVHKIYMTYIKEWEHEYIDPNVLDGTSWSIKIMFSDDSCWEWSGVNAYPPLWKRFLNAINSLDLPNVK